MRARIATMALVVLTGLAVWLLYPRLEARAQSDDPIRLIPGVPAQGSVTTRFGEEWILAGCAGDVMTATIQSTAFAPNLELYPPVGRTPVATTRNTNQRQAQLARTALPENGEYTLVALGATVRDRGAYSMTVAMSGTVELPEGVGLLSPGTPMTGTVSNRDGEEWSFYGCARDVITLTMQSTGPTPGNTLLPLLELYGPTGRSPLARSTTAAAANRSATIKAFALPETGNYTVLAAGQSIRDRGPYSLTLLVTTISAPLPTPTPTSTPTSAAPLCTVVSAGGLRLRSGPGTVYPSIGGFQLNAQLRPRGRDTRGAWIQVEQVGGTQRGWVSAATQYVRCNVAINTLPLAPIPPVPAPTATPRPTNTPVPVVVEPGLPQPEGALVQGPGGNPGNMAGDIYTARGSLAGYNDFGDPVFRGPFFFEMFVFDPAQGAGSGAGIDRVEFRIVCPNGLAYTRIERTARFCVFGGGEPNCGAIELSDGGFLPDSQCSIEDGGRYSVNINVFPSDDRRRGGNWNFDFDLDLSGN